MHNFEPDFAALKGTFLGWARANSVELIIIGCVLVVVVVGAVVQ